MTRLGTPHLMTKSGINYGIWLVRTYKGESWRRRFWFQWWTPVFHEDGVPRSRGPYISIGLGLFALGRGY